MSMSESPALTPMDEDVAAVLDVPTAALQVDLVRLEAAASRRRGAGRLAVALAVPALIAVAAWAVVHPPHRAAETVEPLPVVIATALPIDPAAMSKLTGTLSGSVEALKTPPEVAGEPEPQPEAEAKPAPPPRRAPVLRASVERSAQIRMRPPEPAVQRIVEPEASPTRSAPPPSPEPRGRAAGRSFEDFAGGRASYPRFATRPYEG